MEVVSFKVSQYRSISSEISADDFNGLTIVGKNNSGKTNLLKAMRVFFEGKRNPDLYDYQRDKPHNTKRGQTSFAVKFLFSEEELNDVSEDLQAEDEDDEDDVISKNDSTDDLDDLSSVISEEESLDETLSDSHLGSSKPGLMKGKKKLSLRDRYLQLFSMIDDSRLREPQNEVTVHLTISNQNNYFYTVFKGYRRKTDVTSSMYTSRERSFVEKILSGFECVYIPSSKSVDEIYQNLLLPYVRSEVASAMETSVEIIHNKLAEVSNKITNEMALCGVTDCSLIIKAPPLLDDLFGRFEVSMMDTIENVLSSKGMGLQCLSLFSSFKSISEKKNSEGKKTIWMVEEPESFLHPSLSRACNMIFQSLRKTSYVLVTTHSLSFVSDDTAKIMELYKDTEGYTKDRKHDKRFNAVASIRDNLGVRFADFFNIARHAIFVEGITDKQYIQNILKLTSMDDDYKNKWPTLRDAQIDEFGGVSQLGGFLRGCYEFIKKDSSVIAVFDGDEAGVRERSALQSFFMNKKNISFEGNKDYVSVRSGYPIEGLFPDVFIKKAMEEHPSWFIGGVSIDADGVVEPFRMQDTKKSNLQTFFLELCRNHPISTWISRWEKVFDSIERALVGKDNSIANTQFNENGDASENTDSAG
ncbi:AAA family ATPase [Edwardsiella piscicida]